MSIPEALKIKRHFRTNEILFREGDLIKVNCWGQQISARKIIDRDRPSKKHGSKFDIVSKGTICIFVQTWDEHTSLVACEKGMFIVRDSYLEKHK